MARQRRMVKNLGVLPLLLALMLVALIAAPLLSIGITQATQTTIVFQDDFGTTFHEPRARLG